MNEFVDWIRVEGARTHNLKNVSVDLPKSALVAFTGVSGSGKSSLAIDTIHALSQQWYLEGLSPFVRKFLVSDGRPDVDSITGLGASLAVDQQGSNSNPDSTVGSLVGARHPLRLLFSRLPAFASGTVDDARSRPSTAFDPTHPDGQCHVCLGVGGDLEVDPSLVVAHPERSLLDGASDYAGKLRTRKGSTVELASIPALAKHFGADLATPWNQLPSAFRTAFLFGTDEKIDVEIPGGGTHTDWSFNRNAPLVGAVAELGRLHRDAKSERARKKYRAFFRLTPCETCSGSGVSTAARTVTINNWTYSKAANAVVGDLRDWMQGVPDTLNATQAEIATPLLHEISTRIGSLARLGLEHVALARSVPTLSGGELQRVRLSAQLGSGLTGIVYVLDEPSSGLHPDDRDELVEVLAELRNRGNTVLIVEHDMEIVRQCDWVVDLGPGAGTNGGTVLASGPPAEVATNSESVTAPFLQSTTAAARRRPYRQRAEQWLEVGNINRNNVTNATITIPLHRYTCITGVSGSGKSSVLTATADAVAAELSTTPSDVTVTGSSDIRWVEHVTQAPIGRNGRSNPATYTKLFNQIRRLFASCPEAIEQGLDESSFSFNTDSGRCPECDGNGELTIDMHYLPSITTMCPVCKGKRFQSHILAITIDEFSIADVLDMTVEQAARTPALQVRAVSDVLVHLIDVGLGYLTLGQPAPALSGGEAQRLKLARLLTKTTKAGRGLVILDEPTAGLHPSDANRIIDVIESLVDRGTTVLIADHQRITHREADWVITTGPGAGPSGGQIMSQAAVE